jgi:DNA polymerase I-like protein with 3'-5' exonuclease and polymerase domains
MQIRGVRINIEQKDKLAVEFSTKAEEAQENLNQLAGKEVNINSNPQLARLFYSDLQFPIQYDHKTKQITTGKDARNRLLKKYPLRHTTN